MHLKQVVYNHFDNVVYNLISFVYFFLPTSDDNGTLLGVRWCKKRKYRIGIWAREPLIIRPWR